MTQETSEIVVLLDRSGSMNSIKDDTIGGFNAFVADQKSNQSTKCLLTLIQFDDRYEVNYMSKPIEEVPDLTEDTFVPRGMTALHDAIGKTITGITDRHSSLSDDERPGQVMFVIITDGHENASKEWKGQAKDLILSKEDWDFLYLGAGIDEMQVSQQYGININTVSSYDKEYSAAVWTASSGLLNESRDVYKESGNAKRSRLRRMSEETDFKAGIKGSQGLMDEDSDTSGGDKS